MRRFLATSLLLGVMGWVISPLATAHSYTTAVQVARVHTVNPVEQAVVTALASAVRSNDVQAVFIQSLQESLATIPDGEALLDRMADAEDLSTLIDLLLGALLRAAGPATMAVIQPTVTHTGFQIGSGDIRASEPVKVVLRDTPTETTQMFFTSVADFSIGDLVRTISSARPLGP